MKSEPKKFNCIEMQDGAALRIHEALKGKTREEELAYWRQRDAEARVKYPRLREDARSRTRST